MKWAKKYISIYNQPLDNVHEGIIQEIKQKLAKVQSDEPVVTVSVIAYNEERHLLPCLWALSEMRCEYPRGDHRRKQMIHPIGPVRYSVSRPPALFGKNAIVVDMPANAD